MLLSKTKCPSETETSQKMSDSTQVELRSTRRKQGMINSIIFFETVRISGKIKIGYKNASRERKTSS